MEYDRSQLFFILNDISKEKNLTFILKIPTRLTGINPLSWKVPASRSCPVHVRVHTHTHTLTRAAPGHPPGSRTNRPAGGTEVTSSERCGGEGPTFRQLPAEACFLDPGPPPPPDPNRDLGHEVQASPSAPHAGKSGPLFPGPGGDRDGHDRRLP